ncbi:MAG: Hsp20/alpha crystallin family protein [Deltaproteobacteria bacterium]|nr:MAG: Hsp20/alpha crystallin family protein [Deltaproteobacteria bacterium]
MPGLIIWKNQEIDKLRRDMDRLFARVRDDFGMPLFPRIARDVPSIDLSETEDDLIIKVEIPGIDPEDLDISIAGDILSIKGEMKQGFIEESEDYHQMERRYGSFSRTIQLPCRVMIEDVEATYKKGILNIVMPKCKPETARALKIKVK